MTATHAHAPAGHAVHIEAALRHLIRAADDFVQGDGSRVEVDLDYCAALADLERAVERAKDVWTRHRRGVLRPRARRRDKAPDSTSARRPQDTDLTAAARPDSHLLQTLGEHHG